MRLISSLPIVILSIACNVCRADDPAANAPKMLFDPAQEGAASAVVANETVGDTTFIIKDGAIDITVKANGKSSFPGIVITPKAPWNASGFGHVETTITNTGTKPIRANLRIDDAGNWKDDPFSATVLTVKPGETKPLAAIIGYSYGKKGYALKSEAIVKAIIFVGKSDTEQTFRVGAIQAAGPAGEKPYIDPNTVAVKPAGGQVLGGAAAFDAARQVTVKGGAKVTASDGKSVTVGFAGKAGDSALIKPVAGMWNLNDHLQVRVKIRNTGTAAASPSVELQSRSGPSATIRAAQPIAPGAEAEIVVPFMAAVPWKGADLPEMHDQSGPERAFKECEPGTGTRYTSNTTTGVLIVPDARDGAVTLQVTSVLADMPPRQPLPAWLGKRPPVDEGKGDWTLTFEDNFDGNAIDLKKWNIYSEGEWHIGKATAWTKDNVIVKDGKLNLRVDKRKAHHNDDPALPQASYAAGNCDSYGKWVQRYGYFESRLKMPNEANQFIAFWMMPDRGLEYGQSKDPAYGEPRRFQRNSTNGFGMEFDIMEQLSIWGPNRHDFGMHWDHYMKNHKSIGTFSCYFQPDEEGYLTVGMLWTPGSVVMYQQGREAARWDTKRISSIPSYFILQHVTGGWETEGMDDSQLPSDMLWDYVRAWQRKDLASAVDGPKPNDGGPYPPGAKPATKPATAPAK